MKHDVDTREEGYVVALQQNKNIYANIHCSSNQTLHGLRPSERKLIETKNVIVQELRDFLIVQFELISSASFRQSACFNQSLDVTLFS